MGHFLGVEKRLFLIRGAEAAVTTGQPRRLNPVDPCPRGLPGVGSGRYYTRARAYTAYAVASIIFGRFLSAAHGGIASFATFPSKTSITRGAPVVAVAVSLDPILPHR